MYTKKRSAKYSIRKVYGSLEDLTDDYTQNNFRRCKLKEAHY